MSDPFTLMVKPVGSTCNMACRYCYYLGNEASKRQLMKDDILEKMIRNYFSNTQRIYSFIWHGGEPTLAGLDFYKKAVSLEKKYLPEGSECWNNLQTNGLGLDEKWCEFLKEEHFDVGVSIDGTKLIHDTYRKDASGNETYERIRNNSGLLKRYGIRPDLLCTVNAETVLQPYEVYQSLKDLDTGWIQFIPIVNKQVDGTLSEDSVDPERYGNFLSCIFQQWISDFSKLGVQLFMEALNVYAGGSQSLCWLQKRCGKVLVAECDGSVYSCDHFVNAKHQLGNVERDLLDTLIVSNESFGQLKEKLPEKCQKCRYLFLCNGGCIKDRDEEGNNVLCAAYFQLFETMDEPLKLMTDLLKKKYSFEQISDILKEKRKEKWKDVSRNDRCPCGSGRKYKNCCGK